LRASVGFFILMRLALAAGSMLLLSACEQYYDFPEGGTFWDLSAAYHADSSKWGGFLDANPFLKRKGRVFIHPDGRIIAWTKSDEKLSGFDRIEIEVTSVPVSSLGPAFASSEKHKKRDGGGWDMTPILGGASYP